MVYFWQQTEVSNPMLHTAIHSATLMSGNIWMSNYVEIDQTRDLKWSLFFKLSIYIMIRVTDMLIKYSDVIK